MRRAIAAICAGMLASEIVAPVHADAAFWVAAVGVICAIGAARKNDE